MTYNVLFLCTGNSARSILAEAVLNKIGGDKFTAYSAGSDPKGQVNPHALALLKRLGYPTSNLRSKSWNEFAQAGAPQLDFIFTVCDNAANEVCPVWPGQPMTAHWGVPDPAAVQGTPEEIARAFLVPEATIAQRIVRAKRTLSASGLAYETPRGEEMAARLGSVLEVIYLIFNEGYAATQGDDWLRPQLCQEALRLGRVLVAARPIEPEAFGLLALMELNASRNKARTDATGEPVLLLDQNRALWDRPQIRRGLDALERARREEAPTEESRGQKSASEGQAPREAGEGQARDEKDAGEEKRGEKSGKSPSEESRRSESARQEKRGEKGRGQKTCGQKTFQKAHRQKGCQKVRCQEGQEAAMSERELRV